MRLLAHLALVLVIGSSVGCCCFKGGGCGPCNSGAYGSYYGGGNSCPGGNCNLQGASYSDPYGGLQSASIPGALPATAAVPGTFPATATAPIVVSPTTTAAAPLATY